MLSSDRRIDSSIRGGSQRVTTPGWGNALAERQRQRRWSNYDAIIGKLVGPKVAKVLNPSPRVRAGSLNRCLLVGSMAGVEVPQLRGVQDDIGIEMASAHQGMAHPVSVYDLDTGEKISTIV